VGFQALLPAQTFLSVDRKTTSQSLTAATLGCWRALKRKKKKKRQ